MFIFEVFLFQSIAEKKSALVVITLAQAYYACICYLSIKHILFAFKVTCANDCARSEDKHCIIHCFFNENSNKTQAKSVDDTSFH